MVVGLDGFEPSTPALSRRCSNQLSYRPASCLGLSLRMTCLLVAIDRLWVLRRWACRVSAITGA